MKNKLIICALFLLALTSTIARAQSTAKMGYVDSRGVSEQLAEVKAAYSQLNDFTQMKQKELQRDADDLRKRIEDYEKGAQTMSEQMRGATERELQALQEKIQIKQNSAQTEIQNKEKTLFEPIEKRIQDAIKQVATENGYTYVFAKEVLLHSPTTDDISSLVVKRLQETAPKTPAPAPTTTKPAGSGTGTGTTTPAPKKK